MADKEGFDRGEVYATIDQRVKGDDEFVDRVLEQHDKALDTKKQRRPALEAISQIIEKRYAVNTADLRSSSKTRTLNFARGVQHRCITSGVSGGGYRALS